MLPHNPNTINVDDDHDAIYWSSRFDCTRDQLREAVKSAGKSVHAVEKFLLMGKTEAEPPQKDYGKLPKP